MNLKVLSTKWWPFCLGLNILSIFVSSFVLTLVDVSARDKNTEIMLISCILELDFVIVFSLE